MRSSKSWEAALPPWKRANLQTSTGFLPGNSIEQSDAEQAYTQSLLGGTETWVTLPRDRWPKSW